MVKDSFSDFFRFFPIVPDCSRLFPIVPDCSRLFPIVPDCSRLLAIFADFLRRNLQPFQALMGKINPK
jgi:hypothetical protein